MMNLEGLEAPESQAVKASTLMREAYFVDFALAMQEHIRIPLMVTGGFRRREAMEQAVASGGADLVGLARPMCVDTDAPARILAGLDELTRYEDQLALLPGWLSFLTRIPLVRALATFSTMYWYYMQMYSPAENGVAAPDSSVLAATREVMKREKQLLADR
jgi:hypothetical protein